MSSAAALRDWSELAALLRTALAIGTAFVLGTLIGFERQLRRRSAGLRTNMLVAVGAAAFADLGLRLRGVEGGTQIIAYRSGAGAFAARQVRDLDHGHDGVRSSAVYPST